MKKLTIGWMMMSVAMLAMADAVDYVDPFIGTAGGGSTFPGAVWPMGMVQPGPDTAVSRTGDYGSTESGYRYASDKLMGFTQNRLSGAGACELQDFLLLPFVGEMPVSTNRFLQTIDKRSEVASPGYYAVEYADKSVKAEITASRRVAYYRYTFAKGGRGRVFVDLQSGPLAWWRKKEPNYPTHRILSSQATAYPEGVIEAHNVVTCWCNDRNIATRIEFSPRPVAVRELPDNGRKGKRWILDFELPAGGAVLAKVAISGVDVEGARKNLKADPAGFDFDARRRDCRAAWERLLSRVKAQGSEDQLKIFYTAIYHAYIQPTTLSDVDGRARYSTNRDSKNSKIVKAEGHDLYSTYCAEWDIFRAVMPLYTIVTPHILDDLVKSKIMSYRAVGMLPKCQTFGIENYCMIGMHSIPVIADAMLKGLTTASPREMLEAAVNSMARERDNAEYDRLGYVPMPKRASVSQTLEFGIDDWAIARIAERAGDSAAATVATKRAKYYRNLFDPTTGMMRARGKNGEWRMPFDPYKQAPTPEERKAGIQNDYTEGGAWQYACHVLQDPEGLVELHGGTEGFAAFLERLFTDNTVPKDKTPECSGKIGQFAFGDEHDQHVPYLWQYANRPDRAAETIHTVCTKYFSTKPNGICGNDDSGQLSSWYVFAALGFYPVNPCSGTYVIGAPQLPRMEIALEGGRTFTVIARNLTERNIYVKSVTLNGKPLKGFLLKHADITAGGELVFEMCAGATEPLYCVVDISGGKAATSYPVSYLTAVPAGGWSEAYKTDKIVLRRIKAGTFTMGSPAREEGRRADETQHRVTLTKDYWLGVFPVTQRQWELVKGMRPSRFTTDYQLRPVEQVSYKMIRGDKEGEKWPATSAVADWTFLGFMRRKTGMQFDLPTEAQWEYACRAGNAAAFNAGAIGEVGRYGFNGGYEYRKDAGLANGTAAVGSFRPNAWGLYDMHGNVWEWCLDWYAPYGGDATDPKGALTGENRVLRGGGFDSVATSCRSAIRGYYLPFFEIYIYGFRLCCPAE